MKHRVALIGGFGSVAGARKSLPPSCELVGLCDIKADRIAACQAEDPSILCTTDYREIAAMPGCDTVCQLTPNEVHARITIACLEGGKNVWMEKPIGINLEESEAVLAAQQAAGKHVAVDLEYRFSHMTGNVVKGIIDSGEIGDVLSIENDHWRGGWTNDTPQGSYRTKRRTSGIMKMEGIHQVDFFRFIAGEVTAIQCFAAPNALPHYEFPDNLTVMFWFASGARGRYTINHTRSAMSLGQDWAKAPDAGHIMFWGITGTKGSLMIDAWRSAIRVFHFVANPPGSDSLQPELDRVLDFSARPNPMSLFHDMSGYRYDFLERMARGDGPLQPLADSIITERIAHLADQTAVDGVKVDLT